MPLPSLTPAQRQEALQRAAEARRRRAELKVRLKRGHLGFGTVLNQASHDQAIAKMKVVAALESLPRVGKVRARRIMDELNISESRRIGGLSPPFS